jgi:drug/metabolite transporter (DMT)-like permease
MSQFMYRYTLKNMDHSRSYIYVGLAIFLWASTASVGKLLVNNLNNLQVLFYSSLFASIGLFIITLFQKKLDLIRKYKPVDFFRFASMGFIGVFLYNLLFLGALMYSSAQEVFIVNYTWPIWVILFSVFILKEKLNVIKMSAFILGFIGILFVASGGNLTNFSFTNLKGNLLALAGAISYGLFSVLGKKNNDDKIVSILFYNVFAFMFVCITILLFSEIPAISLFEFICLLWLGVFTIGLAYVFWFFALKYGDTAKMSTIIFITPFLSLVYIYFLLDEEISIYSIIGLIIILSGIIVQSFNKKKTS